MVFLDHNGIKLESNNEVSGKISNIFKLNQKHVSNHESKRKSQGILENILNLMGMKTAYRVLWDAAKAVLKGN